MSDVVEKLLKRLPVCPYDRRSPDYFTAPNDKPCVVCGGINEAGSPDLCRGADTRVMDEAAAEITDLRDKLASAIKERDSICEKAVEKTFALDAAEARAAEAEAESDRLRLALEPFAREADNAGGLVLGPDTDDWTLNHHKLTLGDIRRARQALKEQTP